MIVSGSSTSPQGIFLELELTSERSCHENRCESTNTSNKRSARNSPIFASDVMMVGIATAVDCYSYEYEDLSTSLVDCFEIDS